MKIFGLEDAGQEAVVVVGNIPGCMNNEAFVDKVKVTDAKAPIFFGPANVLPRTKSNRISGIIIMDPCPPYG